MSKQSETKAVVTVTEMARMVSLSRARFYQLVKTGVFPSPLYDIATKRPFYDEELQQVCMEVRRRNCGVNGKPVLFYSTGGKGSSPMPKKRRQREPRSVGQNNHAALIDGLRGLGLASVTDALVEAAIKQCFPGGTKEHDAGEVLRAVFLQIQRQNASDNVV